MEGRFPLGDLAWLDYPEEYQKELIRTAGQMRAAGLDLPDCFKKFDPFSSEKMREMRMWILDMKHESFKRKLRKLLGK